MKKITKLLSVFVIAGAVSAGLGVAAGCSHKHTYSEDWSTDATQHWHAATCEHTDEKSDLGNHVDEDNDGKCDVCDYTLAPASVAVTGVTLDTTSKSLIVGDEFTLTATVAPSNATNKSVTWASSDDNVATVDQSGKVTAVGAGTANITVTTADGNFTAQCAIKIEAKVSFNTFGRVEIGDVNTVNGKVSLPDEVTDSDYTFEGWYTDVDRTIAFDPTAAITSNITLYAKWTKENTTLIFTAKEFCEFRTASELVGDYELGCDIDLDGVALEASKSVVGAGVTFNGKGYTISNASYSDASSKTGLLSASIKGGTVSNVKFLNCVVTSVNESAGLLTGLCEGASTISGIEFNSCSASTTGDYAGLIYARNTVGNSAINISEITVKNGSYTSCSQYGGLLVGDMVGTTSVSFKNLDIDGEFKVSSGNGSFIAGRTRAGATVSVENAVIKAVIATPTKNGIFSGNGACASLTIKNVLIVSSNSSLVAAVAPTASAIENLYVVSGVTVTGSTGTGTDSAEWLQTNGFDFSETGAWMTEGDGYRLKAASTNVKSDSAVITDLKLNTVNTTIRYKEGESYSSAGLSLMGVYSDGVQLVLKEGVDFTVDSSEFVSQMGTYTITIVSTEDATKTATYTVNVVKQTGFAVYDEFMTHTYLVGGSLDTANLVVKSVWSDGVEEKLSSGYSVSSPDMNIAGGKEVSVSYGSYQAQIINIDVVATVPTPVENTVYVNVDAASSVANGTQVKGVETFKTVADAIDYLEACKFDKSVIKVVYIAAGTYEAKITATLDNLVLIGQGADANATVLTYSAVESTVDIVSGSAYGLSCATLQVNGSGFKAYNLSIRNDFNYVLYGKTEASPQGLALTINGDGAVIANCHLYGNQDTLYLKSGRAYFYQTQIDGNIDFIFGEATGLAYFEECKIVAINKSSGQENNNGYVTAMKADETNKPDYGYIFYDCEFTDDGTLKAGSMSLGRPWGKSATVAYIECSFTAAYSTLAYDGSAKSRWFDMSGNLPQNADFCEYGSTGDGAVTEAVLGGKVLTEAEAANYVKQNIFAATNGKCAWTAAWDCDAAYAALLTMKDKATTATGIYASEESITLEEGKTETLLLGLAPWNLDDKSGALDVQVGDPEIATYEDGVVTGVAKGTTTITVSYGTEFVKVITVNVTVAIPEDLTVYDSVEYVFGNSDYEESTASATDILVDKMLVNTGSHGSFVKHNDGSKYYKITGDATVTFEVTAGTQLIFATYGNDLKLTLDGTDVTASGVYSAASGDCTYTYTASADGTLVLQLAEGASQLYLTQIDLIVPIAKTTTVNLIDPSLAVNIQNSVSYYKGIKVDASNSGKFALNGTQDWIQFNNGTVLTLLVAEGSTVTVEEYNNAGLVSIDVTDTVATITATGNTYIKSITVTVPVREITYTYTYGATDNGAEWSTNTQTTTVSTDATPVTGLKLEPTTYLQLAARGSKVTVSITGFTTSSSSAQPYAYIDLLDDQGNVVGRLIGTTTAGKVVGSFTFSSNSVTASAEFSSVKVYCGVDGKGFGVVSISITVEL